VSFPEDTRPVETLDAPPRPEESASRETATVHLKHQDSDPVTPVPGGAAPLVLPLLPLKNTVLFPYLFIPLSVGRPQSLAAVEAALATE